MKINSTELIHALDTFARNYDNSEYGLPRDEESMNKMRALIWSAVVEESDDDKIDIRQELHRLCGLLRNNEVINAYDLLKRMSKQMDDEYYGAVV